MNPAKIEHLLMDILLISLLPVNDSYLDNRFHKSNWKRVWEFYLADNAPSPIPPSTFFK